MRNHPKSEKAFGKVLEFLDCLDDDLVKLFKKDKELDQTQWDRIEEAQEKKKGDLYEFTSNDGIDDFITELKKLESKSMI